MRLRRRITYLQKTGYYPVESFSIIIENFLPASNSIECHSRKPQTITTSLFQTIYDFFCELILPQGYPDSVSDDYFAYQLWDTIQAFCSTITGIFTTQAVLKGVGVGNATATALSATITWILKDGTGMVGRIIFAWWKG